MNKVIRLFFIYLIALLSSCNDPTSELEFNIGRGPGAVTAFMSRDDFFNIKVSNSGTYPQAFDILSNDQLGNDKSDLVVSINASSSDSLYVQLIGDKVSLTVIDPSFSGEYTFSYEIINNEDLASATVTFRVNLADNSNIGVTLYDQKCSSCHGDIESSPKRGRSYHDIKNAISNTAAMKTTSLENLTDEQLNAISLALANSANESVDPDRLDLSLRVGGKKFVLSALKQIFGESILQATEVKTGVMKNPIFGNGCDMHSAVYTRNIGAEFEEDFCHGLTALNYESQFSISRSALTTSVCSRAVQSSTAYNEAMSKVGSPTAPYSDAAFIKLYQLFYLGETPSNQVKMAFKNIFKSQTTTSAGWKSLMLGLCISPEWQVIR